MIETTISLVLSITALILSLSLIYLLILEYYKAKQVERIKNKEFKLKFLKIIDIYDNVVQEVITKDGFEYPKIVNKVIYKENNIIKEIYLDLEYSIYNYTDSEIINLILEAKE